MGSRLRPGNGDGYSFGSSGLSWANAGPALSKASAATRKAFMVSNPDKVGPFRSTHCPAKPLGYRVPRSLCVFVLLVLATPSLAQRPAPKRGQNAIQIPHEQYRLANGLTVILAPNSATPRAAVDLWYHVGSKNEVAGRTGFAHM